jgi:hypothetical protein
MKSRSVLSQAEKFEVGEYIRKRIKRRANGTFKYIDGMNDARIAVHFNITEQNVRAVRMAAFGSLISYKDPEVSKAKPADNTGAGIIKRLEKVESIMSRLCNELGVNYE